VTGVGIHPSVGPTFRSGVLLTATLLLWASLAAAENGHAAWLRYAALAPAAAARAGAEVPRAIYRLGDDVKLRNAEEELRKGVEGMLGRPLDPVTALPQGGAIVIGTLASIRASAPALAPAGDLPKDAFWLRTVHQGNRSFTVIAGGDARGALYGAFAWLRRLSAGELLDALDAREVPYAPVRWVNQWDNLDGSIERGYGGRSVFWANGKVREDLTKAGEYARLLASLGIDAVAISSVNANPLVISQDFVPQVARVAEVMRPWGVRVAIAVDFGSPQSIGKLPTYDPVDPAVAAWWKSRADALYAAVPDFAGFVLKADSEGRVGPSTYGRTHADAANVVARALKPHGGILFYRGFVYDHHMDWRNLKNDRARAAYDNFHPLDGQFDDNVIIQIKHGPIDFQVREPASPLFAGLEKTNEAIELQITQEYFGQARHHVFLAPMWKDALDFDMRVKDQPSPVKALVAGRVFTRPLGGFVGVANVGEADNWMNNHLSQANLYAFGRLAWNPDLTPADIAGEWSRQTFGLEPQVTKTVGDLLLTSWRTFENYTGPLGLQTLTDIVGNHYGVAVEASEENGWGQWHRADKQGVGMDRSVATGTGFVGQYPPSVAKMYETVEQTPDDLLVFMHHVPYSQRLKSGKTVIQFIYDSHYEGADAVAKWASDWRALRGLIDDERYQAVLKQLEYQSGQAIVWRDAVTRWFHRASGVSDEANRVGVYPGRIEAEAARLQGYRLVTVAPWETASGSGAVECPVQTCTATFRYTGQAGARDIAVQYFDVNTGAAKYRVTVGGKAVGEWTANDRIPTRKLDGSSSSRFIVSGVELKPGDEIQIEGLPDAQETAALDYIEIRSPK
jgi:alpha-glucuronidase